MGDIKPYSNREFFSFFQSGLPKLRSETAHRYRTTLSELDLFLTGHRLLLANLSEEMADDWASELLRRGLAKSTVIRHLNILSSLTGTAVKKGMMAPNDAPRIVARKLAASVAPLPPLMVEQTFTECLEILRKSLKDIDSGHNMFTDILLFSLLSGAMPLREVAMLRRDGEEINGEMQKLIAGRNQGGHRKYLFDLRQSYLTPKQIYARINEEIGKRFGRFAAPGAFDADSFVRSLWIAMAMKSGATTSEAAKSLDIGAEGEEDNENPWQRPITAMLTHDMPRWYAMHMRRGVTYDDLYKEISENIHPVPELFYPSETIKRRVGNKTVLDDKPFISGTVFFKSYPESVLPMFTHIGDKAWCYRVTRGAGSPYAVIPSTAMKRFQAVIGVFTPDMEIQSLGTLTPKPGEPVIVIKAGYSNRRGEVEEVIDNGSGTAIVRVKLSTDQGYEWRVDLTPQQLQPILNP